LSNQPGPASWSTDYDPAQGAFMPDDNELVAVIATLGVVDRDFDVSISSTFVDGQKTLLGAWNHATSQGDQSPVGTAVVRTNGAIAWIEARYFEDSRSQAYRAMLKQALETGTDIGFSYTYIIQDSSTDSRELARYPGARQILKRVSVEEACPCLMPAGIGTGIRSAKQLASELDLMAIKRNVDALGLSMPSGEQADLAAIRDRLVVNQGIAAIQRADEAMRNSWRNQRND